MAFPFETEEVVEAGVSLKIPKEYEIDLSTGQLTGKIVEGVDAIKVWIYNALRTARYRYNIFSWDYGSELEELIGHSYSQEYLNVEAKRMVEDCILINENIISITGFSISLVNDKMNADFTANTLLGEVEN